MTPPTPDRAREVQTATDSPAILFPAFLALLAAACSGDLPGPLPTEPPPSVQPPGPEPPPNRTPGRRGFHCRCGGGGPHDGSGGLGRLVFGPGRGCVGVCGPEHGQDGISGGGAGGFAGPRGGGEGWGGGAGGDGDRSRRAIGASNGRRDRVGRLARACGAVQRDGRPELGAVRQLADGRAAGRMVRGRRRFGWAGGGAGPLRQRSFRSDPSGARQPHGDERNWTSAATAFPVRFRPNSGNLAALTRLRLWANDLSGAIPARARQARRA